MIMLLWHLLSRVFIFILCGLAAKKIVRQNGEPFVRYFVAMVLYVLTPAFSLVSLWNSNLLLSDSWKIAAVAVSVMAGGTCFAWFLARVRKTPFRMVCLPVVFMNSAYLAIPVCAQLWGERGAAYAIIYNAVITMGNLTVGIWWVSPKRSLIDTAGLPALIATIAGTVLTLSRMPPPPFLASANNLLSAVTLPAMLLFMGYRLGGIRLHMMKKAFAGVVLRMGGGVVTALVMVWILRLSGTAAGACVMISAMPAAVYSYIFSEYFHADADFAAAAVSLGTALSVGVIPLIAMFLGVP